MVRGNWRMYGRLLLVLWSMAALCASRALQLRAQPAAFVMQADSGGVLARRVVAACRHNAVDKITQVRVLCDTLQRDATTDMRSTAEKKSWKVIYPTTDGHTPYMWRMCTVAPDAFYEDVPSRVRRAVVNMIAPSTDHFRRLHIVRICSTAITNELLTPAPRRLYKRILNHLEAIAWAVYLCYTVRGANSLKSTHNQVVLQTAAIPAIANPKLANYYYLPVQRPVGDAVFSPPVLNGGCMRDNNVVFASDTICIMQNSWIHPSCSDSSSLTGALDNAYMVCIAISD